ncbi:glycosyltransferase [Ascidiimonas sp. W6]|uniref:glycosyltransferase n=1 Tax=Ascidiimonas meishanensis TaxID=3128903 RepID=UPI0030ECBF91
MKLALVTALPPSKVTLNEYGYHLVKHFAANETVEELILLTDTDPEETELPIFKGNCKITVVNCWKFNSHKNLLTMTKAISQTRPDGVLFNLQFLKFGDKKIPAALGLLFPALCKLRGIPTIVLLHNILERVDLENAGFTKNPILKWIYNFIGATLTRFLLISDLVAVTIQKYVTILSEKYKTEKVVLVPHGAFETPPSPDYKLPQGPKQIMAFGKFGTYKKVEVLIDACELLMQQGIHNIEIVIAGTDSPNTPGYLESVSEKYPHLTNLRFTGYVEEADVPRIFSDSAVVVFPYTSTTGSSGVLHQAGSYGKAVVLPDLSDLGTLIRDEGYSGEFFIPEDAISLASAIKNVITNDGKRISIGKQNYKAACSLPMERIVEIYLGHFERLQSDASSKKAVEHV